MTIIDRWQRDAEAETHRQTLHRLLLRYIKSYRDRHGKLCVYVRLKSGRLQRLRSTPGTDAFSAEYDSAVSGRALRASRPKSKTGATSPNPREEVVYFAKAGERVKIGRSIDPAKRLADLQVGSHQKIALLFTLPGGAEAERAFHLVFDPYHIHGEWFEAGPMLIEFIDRQRRTNRARIG